MRRPRRRSDRIWLRMRISPSASAALALQAVRRPRLRITIASPSADPRVPDLEPRQLHPGVSLTVSIGSGRLLSDRASVDRRLENRSSLWRSNAGDGWTTRAPHRRRRRAPWLHAGEKRLGGNRKSRDLIIRIARAAVVAVPSMANGDRSRRQQVLRNGDARSEEARA